VGRAVYALLAEVSFSCPLILLQWQIWLTCKASSSKKLKIKKALQGQHHRPLPEPERNAWKSFFGSWLSMSLTAEQRLSTPSQQQHIWQLGRYLPFSSFSTCCIDAPRRVIAYIDAFRQLHPHRLVAVDELPYHEAMSQPLFHSWQVLHMGNLIAFFFFFFFEEEALHVSQSCRSQQYQRTAKGNLWDEGVHSTTHNGGSCFAMASDLCVT